jgi:hypothetical protein
VESDDNGGGGGGTELAGWGELGGGRGDESHRGGRRRGEAEQGKKVAMFYRHARRGIPTRW